MKYLAALFLVAAVTGCASGPSNPGGIRSTGMELERLITDATVYGRSAKSNREFVERYHPGGNYEVTFTNTAYTKESGETHNGTWRIEGDEVCYKVASLNSDGCVLIYKHYAQIEFVSPTTGKVAFLSYWVEYGEKIPSSTAVAPTSPAPPATAPVPSPPSPPKVTTAPPSPPTPRSSATPQPPKNLKLAASGSGFIVSNQTYVLTNDHVIEGCVEVTVRIDNRDINAIVARRDGRNDLALLRLRAGKYPTVAFRGNDGLYPGDSVVAIGYPLSDILASEGNVSIGIVSALAGPGNDASLLQVSAPVQPGNSGGPLFDMSGNVVGVIVAQLGGKYFEAAGTLPQNVNFAIKSAVATAFMQASGVEYQTQISTKEMRPADVARKNRPATVFIQCWG